MSIDSYCPPLTRQPDFDTFWAESLQQAKDQPLCGTWMAIEYPISTALVMDTRYSGFDETPIHGYFVLPAWVRQDETIPCVIQFHGYGGSRGTPSQLLPWVMMGMAVLSIDCREQGGLTGSRVPSQGAIVGNISTKGLMDERDYYYRTVYMDCVKAIDFVLTHPQIDPSRIILRGASQGGGLAIAAAALDQRPQPWSPMCPAKAICSGGWRARMDPMLACMNTCAAIPSIWSDRIRPSATSTS